MSRTRLTLADILPGFVAAHLFIPLFIVRSLGPLDFWWWMSLNTAALIIYSLTSDREYRRLLTRDLSGGLLRKLLLGVLSACALYGVFMAGNALSRLILPFAGEGIRQVYGFKQGASLTRMALLMTFLIGPGEELFWRGFLQRRWQRRFGDIPGYLMAALLYALVHLGTGNVMLVLAAATCGLFWGWLYLRFRSVIILVVSHVLWDLAIFLFAPLAG